MVLAIARVVLRQIIGAVSRSERTGRVWLWVTGGALCASAAAFGLARVAAGGIGQPLPARIMVPIVALVLELVFAVAIVATVNSVIDESAIAKVCGPLPISNVTIAAATVVPVLGIAASLAILLMPAALTVLDRLVAISTGAWALGYATVVELGLIWGLLGALVSRAVTRALRGTRGMAYPVGLILMGALGVAEGVSISAGKVAPLSWLTLVPALLSAADNEAVGRLLALFLASGLVLAVVVFAYCVCVLRLSPRQGGSRPAFTWRSGGSLPLFRLEVVRLLRQPRVTGSLCAILLIVVAGAAALTRVNAGVRSDLFGALVVGGGVAMAQPALLSRGYSPRLAPMEVRLFGRPAAWALTVAAAAGTIVLVPFVVVLVAAWLVFQDAGAVVFAAGGCMLAVGSGYLVGTIFPVGPKNVAGEMVGLTLVAVAVYGCLAVVGHFAASPIEVGVVSAICGGAAAAGAAEVESRRWQAVAGSEIGRRTLEGVA
jgi:hypothetical protein